MQESYMPNMSPRMLFKKEENAYSQSRFVTRYHHLGIPGDYGPETDHLGGRFHYWPPVKKCSIFFFS